MPQEKQFKLSAAELLADSQMTNESKMTAATKFKSLMILNGVIQKKENNAFEALKWNAQTKQYGPEKVKKPAGSYYMFLEPKENNTGNTAVAQVSL